MKIELYKNDLKKIENLFLSKKIKIINVIGILVILNIVNFLTKKVLGYYVPIASGLIIVANIIDYVLIIKNEHFINYIYNNKISFAKNENIITIFYKDEKSKTYKNIRTVYSNNTCNLFDPLEKVLYLNNSSFEKIEFKYTKSPLEIRAALRKRLFGVLLVSTIMLELAFVFILKSIIPIFVIGFSWIIIVFLIRLLVFEEYERNLLLGIFDKIDGVIFKKDEKFFYLENDIFYEIPIKERRTSESSNLLNIEEKTIFL